MRTLLSCVAGAALLAAAAHAEEPQKPTDPKEPNAVQVEMQALNAAMHTVLTAIANNELEKIPPAIFAVHGPRGETAKALKEGRYHPPKRPDDVAAFVKQDDAFHDDLVKLVRAAKADDLPAATRQVGVIIEGCTSCHVKYRW